MAGETTVPGYVNKKDQRNLGSLGISGTDHMQVLYRMQCQRNGCGETYAANGSDI